MITHNFWATHKLSLFELNLKDCNVEDDTVIKVLDESVLKMTELRHIYLRLGHTKITDLSLKAFTNNILPILKKTESFGLDMHDTKITDLSVAHLFTKMKKIAGHIKILGMGLSNTQVTDASLEILAKQVVPMMGALQSFQLILHHTKVTDS